jgi:hypothetical protein
MHSTAKPVIIHAMTVWLRPIIPLGIIKIIKEELLIAEYHHNMDNEREAAAIAKENKTTSNAPEGTIGSSIIRLMDGDTTLKTLSITTQCYCDMEIMSNYNNHIRREEDGDLQVKAVNEFFDRLNMSGDLDDDAVSVGAWVSGCGGIERLRIVSHSRDVSYEYCGDDDVLDNETLTGFYEEISRSKSIVSLEVHDCRMSVDSLENAVNLLSISNLMSVEFNRCKFELGGTDVFVRPKLENLQTISFVDCSFSEGEDNNCMLYMTTMKSLTSMTIVRCKLGSCALKTIIRDIKGNNVHVVVDNS